MGTHSPLIHSKPSGQSSELGAEVSGSLLSAEVALLAASTLDEGASLGIELTSEAGALDVGSSLAGALDTGVSVLAGAEEIDEASEETALEGAELASGGAEGALISAELAAELAASDGADECSELAPASPPPSSCSASSISTAC